MANTQTSNYKVCSVIFNSYIIIVPRALKIDLASFLLDTCSKNVLSHKKDKTWKQTHKGGGTCPK